ncbi:uncharacterized protein [Nicotiana tomentosiformis]|uniref:uncharacterized protein n=1 Tax=Nicotiana tomentosiformis TaxID=4098 RepID=UPI00388C6E70
MVRIRVAVPDDVTPRVDAVMVRGKGRRGACAATREPTRAAAGELPVVPVGGASAGGACYYPQTSGDFSTVPEHVWYIGSGGVISVCTSYFTDLGRCPDSRRPYSRAASSHWSGSSGLASESAQGFLEECHSILRTMDIVETSEVAFTMFHLKEAAHQWWRAYEFGIPTDATSLTWVQFSEIFLRKFVPQSLRDAWRVEFEQLRLGTMSVLGYAVRFNDLARHAPALVASVRG